MPIHILDNKLWFPPVDDALEDGLLAVGGDLNVDRLLLAYSKGIFPWFGDDEPAMWWSPDPRFVLYPQELCVSKSMKQVLKSGKYQFRVNTAFEYVINNCKSIARPGQPGTWITNEVEQAYTQLHFMGLAHSAETWYEGKLVGGLYGVLIGTVFFGESMFTHQSDASKFAFINWVTQLQQLGVTLIDCQVYTAHLQSLGARMISRKEFVDTL